MKVSMRLICILCGAACLAVIPQRLSAQGTQSPPIAPAAAAQAVSYPDTAGGLKRLGNDLLNAVKNKDAQTVTVLVRSLMLPDPAAFYHETFGDFSGGREIAAYQQDRAKLPLTIVALFKKAIEVKATEVEAKRFDADCDDADGEDTFPILQARVNKTPLYDLRLFSGTKYFRLWPLAYVDGAFRYLGEPHPWEYFPPNRTATAAPAAPGAEGQQPEAEGGKKITRVRQGGNVTAAKILNKIAPDYPEIAKHEHLSGTVELHALIAKDGTITTLQVNRGYCTLARSSLEAVHHWRYAPTMLMGQAIEVDTVIDVVFQMNR
jgi:TonB family protein